MTRPKLTYDDLSKLIALVVLALVLVISTFIYLPLGVLMLAFLIFIIAKTDKQKYRIKKALKDSLIISGVYVQLDDTFIEIPKIKVNTHESKIIIDISNTYFRSKIEANIEYLSSGLPKGLKVKDYYLSKDESELVINYIDTTINNRLIFDSFDDYKSYALAHIATELFIDKDYSIDLIENNGILVTGSSGSGKSYWIQSLILQGLIKGYEIDVLDIKRSYQAFEGVCNCAYTVDDIVAALDKAIEELEERQKKTDELLRYNPRALAIDLGYPIKLIIIEEYMALMNTDAPKKTLEGIEAKVKRLVVTGRALNINILLVTQVAAANTLNSSIRANLPVKLVFGNANRTILETTFGIGNTPKINTYNEKGEGLLSFGNDIVHFSAPTLSFDVVEALKCFETWKSE